MSHMGPSALNHEHERGQGRYALISFVYYDARYDRKFYIEAVDGPEAVKRAMAADTQVFISDSGDNTTAGASGDNAYMLNLLLQAGAEGVLVAGITDEEAVNKCYEAEIGDLLTLNIGGSLSPRSEKAQVAGRLVRRGNIRGYAGNEDVGGRRWIAAKAL